MPRPNLTAALDRYADLKRAVCAEACGPADLVMLMEVIDTAGHVVMVAPENALGISIGVRSAAEVLPEPIANTVVICEAFLSALPSSAPPPAHGQLQARYYGGDASVEEVMIAVSFDSVGITVDTLTRRCAYDDAGLPTFPHPDKPLDALLAGGAIIGAMREALR